MKRFIAMLLALSMVMAMTVCAFGAASAEDDVKSIIAQAQDMTLEELAKKAIEESNGKKFYGVGNSSRGKSALPLFISYLQTIDPSYNMEFEWHGRSVNWAVWIWAAAAPSPSMSPTAASLCWISACPCCPCTLRSRSSTRATCTWLTAPSPCSTTLSKQNKECPGRFCARRGIFALFFEKCLTFNRLYGVV